ncbi:MAG: hypothetical protein ACOC1G_05730 [Phycisphaeraceae bacterium]
MRYCLLMTLCLAVVSGCGTAGSPHGRVLDAALVEETPDGSRIEFVVELENPREEHYPLVEARYSLEVIGAGTFWFTEYPIQALPGNGTQRLLLAGALPATDLAGRQWRVNGAVSYKPGGELRQVLTDSGIPLPVVNFDGRGKLETVVASPR